MADAVFRKAAPLYDVTPVDNIFILEYMTGAPEGYVKAYLFGLMQSACPSADAFSISSALGMSDADVACAFAYWEQMGLVRILASEPLTVEFLRTWQERRDVVHKESSGKYAELVSALTGTLGTRILTPSELQTIFDWIEVFGFDEAAAIMCVRYCIELRGARVSVKYMDAVARSWADSGKITAQDIENHLIEQEGSMSAARAILKRWHLSRRVTDDEIALYNKWAREWGFDDAAILSACSDLTTVGTPSFRALDRILETYKMNGAFTEEAAIMYRRKQDMISELAREMFEHAGIKRSAKAAELDFIEEYFERKHVGTELMLLAADYAREAASQFAALKKTLADWYDNGVATVEAAKARQEGQGISRERSKKSASYNGRYAERKYSSEDFKNIGIKLIDDEE